jgi:hypothetical protein
MSMMDSDMIQPGWTVVDARGEEIGKVSNAEGPELVVKKSGLLGGEVHVPRNAVSEVETGRVELNVAKNELG